jgi:hypothetical protein
MRKLFKKLREAKAKTVKDKRRQLTYSSGMMMETEGGDGSNTSQKPCYHCKRTCHQRVTSRLCPMNRTNLAEAAESAETADHEQQGTCPNVMAREPEESSIRNSKQRRCRECNLSSHQRASNRLCPKNKMNLAQAAKVAKNKHEREGKYDI